jgi:hypothetical protein
MTYQDRIELLARRAFDNPQRALVSADWYNESGQWCASLDEGFSLKPGTVAGFVAALSPLNGWEDQLRFTPPSLAACLKLLKNKEYCGTGIKGPGFFSNRDKAARILAGEKPLDVLKGDKVTRFFKNLTGDESVVTVDRHIISAIGLDGDGITPKRYRNAELAFQCVAPRFALSPAGLQALVWVYWREVKNGRDW